MAFRLCWCTVSRWSDTRMWDEQESALSDIAMVVRYDARGFGRSTRDGRDIMCTHADDLWRLLDHLAIGSAVLVGLSMGGRTVLEAALSTPERVTALVLLDAVVDGVPWDPESDRGMEAISAELRSAGLDAAKMAWLKHGFFSEAPRSPMSPSDCEQMVANYSGCTGQSRIRMARTRTRSGCCIRSMCLRPL